MQTVEQRQARQRAHWATPEKKAQRKEYLACPEVKARMREYTKKYHASSKGQIVLKRAARRHLLKKLYGITEEQYAEMFKSQKGGCAICGLVNLDGRRLYVDHDHKTEQVRALLCHFCNGLLGHAKENTQILQKAIDYLERFKVLTNS
jgi:hypothetical protein